MYANYYRVNASKNNFNLSFKNLLHEFKNVCVFKYVCVHRRDVRIIKEAGGIFLESLLPPVALDNWLFGLLTG